MVETLWEGVQDLANLRRLILRACCKLRELPDLSKACSLESVDLSLCTHLSDVHASLLSLHSLISLDVTYCFDLKSLKSGIHLKSLRELEILECKNLKEFSVSSEELTSLNLSNTLIEELSPSIVRCSKLRKLYLVDTKLNTVPIQALSCLTFLKKLSISNLQNIDNFSIRMLFDFLRSLQSVSLIECCSLTELPDNITQHSSLELLSLNRCPNLTKLPVSMRDLSKLRYLFVEGCTALRSLPELPPSLRELIATDCTALETVSAIEEQAKFWLQKGVHEKEWVRVSYPGKKVPKWFGNNRTQNDSDTINLSLSSHTLEGFIFCAVVPDLPEKAFLNPVIISGLPEEASLTPVVIFSLGWENIHSCLPFIKVSPGHVILGSHPPLAESILDTIEENRAKHEATAYNPTLSFKLGFGFMICTYPTKECGVYPIYASEYSELNPNSSKGKAIMI